MPNWEKMPVWPDLRQTAEQQIEWILLPLTRHKDKTQALQSPNKILFIIKEKGKKSTMLPEVNSFLNFHFVGKLVFKGPFAG